MVDKMCSVDDVHVRAEDEIYQGGGDRGPRRQTIRKPFDDNLVVATNTGPMRFHQRIERPLVTDGAEPSFHFVPMPGLDPAEVEALLCEETGQDFPPISRGGAEVKPFSGIGAKMGIRFEFVVDGELKILFFRR